MGFVDLHGHSNASDGTLSPSEVVALAPVSYTHLDVYKRQGL